MDKSASVSALISRLKDRDAEAEHWVWERFYREAWAVANRRVGRQLRRRVSASEIVGDAMRSAISEVRKGRLRQNREEDFLKLLMRITVRKAGLARRQARAQVRDVAAEAPLEAAAGIPAQDATPEQLVLFRETFREVMAFIRREPDEQRQQILSLGLIDGFSAPEIRRRLQHLLPGSRLPSARTIQLQLQAARTRLEQALEPAGPASIPFSPVQLADCMRRELETPESPSSHRSVASILANPKPSLEALQRVKNFAKDQMEHPASRLPKEVARVLYLASIAAALARCDQRISSLDDESLQRGLEWAAANEWVEEPIRQVLRRAVDTLGPPRGKRR